MRIPVLLLVLCSCGSSNADTVTPLDGSTGADVLQRSDGDVPGTDAGVDSALPDGAPGTGCKLVQAGTHVLTCNGLSVTVSAPSSCITQSCGLILDIHGIGMSADAEDQQTNLRAIGNAAGYVVVQPTAPDGRTIYGPTWLDTDDDAVWGSTTDVISAWKIDPKRIHVTGFSQGGYMTWRLVCAHSDVIASAAPGAAGTSNCPQGNFNGSCPFTGQQTPKPIDVLFVAGAKDPLVPPSCTTPMVNAVVNAWGGTKQTIASDSSYARDRYVGTAGNDFEVLTHQYTTDPAGKLGTNVGHCVPGATGKNGSIWDDLYCKLPVSFTWGKEVLAFFQAHPKK
jgi:dienelactone hydrolase